MTIAAPATQRRTRLVVASLVITALAFLLLVFTADAKPMLGRRLFGLWQTRYVFLALGLFVAACGFLAAATSRRALLAFFAIGVSAAGAVGLLEGIGALGIVSWRALLSPPASTLGTLRIPHIDVAGASYQDTASRWGLKSDPIPFRYRTDRHGFRNRVDRADADIYLLGDSVLVAALVPFAETVTARLEAAIQRAVMNVALIAKGPQEEQQFFRETRLDVSKRLVIQFIFEGNDLIDSRHFRQSTHNSLSVVPGKSTLTHQLVHVLQRLTQPIAGEVALRSCTIGNQLYTFFWARESYAGLDDEVTEIGNALLRFASEIHAAGGEFAVVFVPSKLRVLGPICRFPDGSDLADWAAHLGPLRGFLGEWSNRSGIALLDLTAPLQGAASAGRIPWFWGDTHWNAEGHAIAAEMLKAWGPVLKASAGRH